MRRTILALAVLVLTAACVPAAADRLQEQISEDPELTAIQRRGVLEVGVPTGPEGLGTTDAGPGLAEDVAGWVADALEVRTEFTYGDTDELLLGIQGGDLDLAFPMMPITEGGARSRKRSYTAPYYVAHQRILLGPGTGDLAGVEDVCTFGDPRTQVPPENVRDDIGGVRSNDAAACGRLIESDIVDAALAPDVLLFELEAGIDGTTLLPESYNTEGYSAIVQYGEVGVANFFDAVLSRAIDDGRWMESYEENIGPLTTLEGEPPDLTAEEAAALFPRGLPLD